MGRCVLGVLVGVCALVGISLRSSLLLLLLLFLLEIHIKVLVNVVFVPAPAVLLYLAVGLESREVRVVQLPLLAVSKVKLFVPFNH